eukprot:753777-Hanusia_phi.AAC.3
MAKESSHNVIVETRSSLERSLFRSLADLPVRYYLATSKVPRQKKILLTPEEFIAQIRRERVSSSQEIQPAVTHADVPSGQIQDEEHGSSSEDESELEWIDELGICVNYLRISSSHEASLEDTNMSPTSKFEPEVSTSHRMSIVIKSIKPSLRVLEEDIPFRVRDELVAINSESLVTRRWQEALDTIKSTLKHASSPRVRLLIKRKYRTPFSEARSIETYVFLKIILDSDQASSPMGKEETISSSYRSSRVIPWPYLPPDVLSWSSAQAKSFLQWLIDDIQLDDDVHIDGSSFSNLFQTADRLKLSSSQASGGFSNSSDN